MIPSSASKMHAALKMAVSLRYYQSDMYEEINNAWFCGFQNVLAVLPTGAGKTVLFAYTIAKHIGAACAIAHRQELVSQISLALARFGIKHKIIGPDSVIKGVVRLHIEELGTNFVDPSSRVAVAGVDTLIKKGKLVKDSWLQQVTLQVHDEAHHVLKTNKWGKAALMFKHSEIKGLFVTATPCRADGFGLGRHADGLIDIMLEGPGTRRLINEGYLTDYKVIIAESDVVYLADMFTATGELNKKGKEATRGSHIVGDVVTAYRNHCNDEPTILFAPDVETSIAMAENFRNNGIAALHVDGDTDDIVRTDAVKKLKQGHIKVLLNVGLFGEGFDLPVIVNVIDAAATESFANYAQRFGRMLRLLLDPQYHAIWETLTPDQRRAIIKASNKPFGRYIDLVGNMIRHAGPPDKLRVFSLDRREKRSGGGSGMSLTITCANKNANDSGHACTQSYERFRACCPYCGYAPVPAQRNGPEFVDGNIFELDEETLQRMRGEVIDVNAVYKAPYGMARDFIQGNYNHFKNAIDAQLNLRESFAWWAGEQRTNGLNDVEIYKKFYLSFNIDAISACALRPKEADILAARIDAELTAPSLIAKLKKA
jgi:DNA repair protein RadD